MTQTALKGTQYVTHPKSDYVLPHRHNCYELIYYIRGSGKTSIDGKNYKYKPDTLALIAPDVDHDEHAAEPSEVLCCQFEAVIAPKFPTQVVTKTDNTAQIFAGIRERMLELHRAFRSDALDEETANGKLWELNLLLFRLTFDAAEKKDNYFADIVAVAKQYIDRHYTSKIRYEILAESLGYSYDRFRHLFAAYAGETLNEYRSSLRLEYAKTLLRKGYRTVEVAKKCGFADDKCFCKWFKAKMQMSPHEYGCVVGTKWRDGIFNPEESVGEVPDRFSR